jgi:hypothetical protein
MGEGHRKEKKEEHRRGRRKGIGGEGGREKEGKGKTAKEVE